MIFKVKVTETFERFEFVNVIDKNEALVKATENLLGEGTINENGRTHFKVEICEEN